MHPTVFSRLFSIIKPGGDRRKERRVKVRLTAAVGGLHGRITDIGLGGFGFYPDDEGLDLGDELMASIHTPDGAILEIPCRIVGADDEGMVLCVAFLKVTPEQFDPLQDIITHQALG
jgi:hypothetical protein